MFESRTDAGKQLVKKLQTLRLSADVVVGITRGGVVVAAEVAKAFALPLFALLVKKLSAPVNPELAIGAIAPDDVTHIDLRVVNTPDLPDDYLKYEIRKKHQELVKQQQAYQGFQPIVVLAQKRAILVDDGVATGATVQVAIKWLRKKEVKHITLALPVVTRETANDLRRVVDLCVILEEPQVLRAVGEFYQNFEQVNDEEVINILQTQNKND